MLGKCAEIEINCRKPALTGIQQAGYLLVGKLGTAAVRVNGKLRVVKPELLCAYLIDAAAKAQNLRRRQKPVASGDDQMNIARQTVCKIAQKGGYALIGQKMKIVDENIAFPVAVELAAQIVYKQAASRVIVGAGIVRKKAQPLMAERVLNAPPENREVIRVNAYADNVRRVKFAALGKIPVYSRRLAIAHGCDDRGHGAAGYRPQTLLQALGYVNVIQTALSLRHRLNLSGYLFNKQKIK